MKLECTLIKVPGTIANMYSRVGNFLARGRYDVSTDAEALSAIEKFIGENISTLTAALTDQRLVAQLQHLSGLTISNLQCLRYILASKGINLWYYYVKDEEINPQDIDSDVLEYNVVDCDQMSGFIPFAVKFTQLKSERSFVKLYSSILDAFGLFEHAMFAGMKNPLKSEIESMKYEEDALGTASNKHNEIINSMLEFLHKDIYVIMQ